MPIEHSDEVIAASINRGSRDDAGSRMAFRQMRAVERVAIALEEFLKLYARPVTTPSEVPPPADEPEA